MGFLLDLALRASGAGESVTPATVSHPSASAPAASPVPEPPPEGPHARVLEGSALGDAPAPVSPGADLDRAIALAELRGLIRAIAAHEPGFWSDGDVAEAFSAGTADLAAAIQTWRALAERLGVALPEDAGAQARRERVLALLRARPGIRYALVGPEDDARYPDCVVLGFGIRRPDGAIRTCDLVVPRERFDALALLDLLERRGGAIQ